MFKHPQKQLALGKYLEVFLIDPSLGIIYIHLLSALHLPIGTFSFERRNTVENAVSTAQMSEPHILPLIISDSLWPPWFVAAPCVWLQKEPYLVSHLTSVYHLSIFLIWVADY